MGDASVSVDHGGWDGSSAMTDAAKRVLCLLMQALGEYLPLESGAGLQNAFHGIMLILDILTIIIG
jgi:hypothetical protein